MDDVRCQGAIAGGRLAAAGAVAHDRVRPLAGVPAAGDRAARRRLGRVEAALRAPGWAGAAAVHPLARLGPPRTITRRRRPLPAHRHPLRHHDRMVTVDAVVVGAGPSGAATALHLARAGHLVTVVDRSRFPRDKACGEGLMPPGVAALRRLRVLDAVLAGGAQPLPGVGYTQPGVPHTAFAAFPAPPGGGPAEGLGVRRLTFDATLVDALRREPMVTLLEGVRAERLLTDRDARVVGVGTSAGPLTARVTVAADGLHSTLRAAAGWARPAASRHGRQRYGVAGHWRVAAQDRPGITITLCGDHEWYEAPVGPDERLVSLLGPRRLVGAAARDYARAARAALPHLRDVAQTSPPRAAGSFLQRPARICGPGLVLVGDAAGYDDPATGEGLATGLLLAEALAASLAALLDERLAPAVALARYRDQHRRLWRDRRRVLGIALWLGRHPRVSRRVIARAARDPAPLQALLAVNCGYRPLRGVRPREWLGLLGA